MSVNIEMSLLEFARELIYERNVLSLYHLYNSATGVESLKEYIASHAADLVPLAVLGGNNFYLDAIDDLCEDFGDTRLYKSWMLLANKNSTEYYHTSQRYDFPLNSHTKITKMAMYPEGYLRVIFDHGGRTTVARVHEEDLDGTCDPYVKIFVRKMGFEVA